MEAVHIKLDVKPIGDKVLVGDSTGTKWNLQGAVQNPHENFTVDTDLVIRGD